MVVGDWVAGGTSGVSAGRGVLTSENVAVVTFPSAVVALGCVSESLLEQAAKKVAAARVAITNLMIFFLAKLEYDIITCRLMRHGDNRGHEAAFVAVFPFRQQEAGEIRRRQPCCGASDAGSSRVLLSRGKSARHGS